MKKKEFAEKLLVLLVPFLKAPEMQRKKMGKVIAQFYRKNEKFDSGNIALNDTDFKATGALAELDEYSKAAFPEEDLRLAKKALEKIVGIKRPRKGVGKK